MLAFFSVFAYNIIVEQKNIGFFRGDGACIVSVFFYKLEVLCNESSPQTYKGCFLSLISSLIQLIYP